MTTLNLIATIFGYIVLTVLVFAIGYATIMILIDQIKERRRTVEKLCKYESYYKPRKTIDDYDVRLDELERRLTKLEKQLDFQKWKIMSEDGETE